MISEDIQKLSVEGEVILYELDLTELGSRKFYYHGYPMEAPIFWKGAAYEPWSIETEGFAVSGTDAHATPTLRVGNIGQDENGNTVTGVVSALCEALQDLVGAKVIRRRTLKKYLDATNFPEGNPSADPTQEFPSEVYDIECKLSQTREYVTFELKSALDFDGLVLPARRVQATVCGWLIHGGYRGPYCGYTGNDMFDRLDNRTEDRQQDMCAGLLSSCRARFGQNAELPINVFPGVGLLRA